MDEADPEELHGNILHIFPACNEPPHIVIHYSQRSEQINNETGFKPKFNIKKITKAYKKLRNGGSRKYPHVTREHTDLNKHPCKMTCPNCLCCIVTNTYDHNCTLTHTIAASLFPICMCVMPYFTTKFKDTSHYCPNCKIFLGTKRGSGKDISILLD